MATRKKPAKKPAKKRKKPAKKKPAKKRKKKPVKRRPRPKRLAKRAPKKVQRRRKKIVTLARKLDDLQDEIEEYAELWGVSYDDAEDVLDTINYEDVDGFTADELDSYIREQWEALGGDDGPWSISDLYDIYYGYEPGTSG